MMSQTAMAKIPDKTMIKYVLDCSVRNGILSRAKDPVATAAKILEKVREFRAKWAERRLEFLKGRGTALNQGGVASNQGGAVSNQGGSSPSPYGPPPAAPPTVVTALPALSDRDRDSREATLAARAREAARGDRRY